jgi:hypothetical protein
MEIVVVEKSDKTGSPLVGKARAMGLVENFASIPP